MPAPEAKNVKADAPWLMRVYSGHSTAAKSNELYRANLAKGQTGLSIAFDLPTQTGFDSDHVLAKGEVGKVGVPVSHIGDMKILLGNIPLDKMNTSMTINAPAAWLMALYVAAAEEFGVKRSALTGTVQNDLLKEFLSRGTYMFCPEASLKLMTDVIAFSASEAPKWNPVNISPYHLQEAGATPVQEIAFSLANAIAVLDKVRDSGAIAPKDFPAAVGRIAFFCNAGINFIEETAKMRAFTQLWDEICEQRYGVTDPKLRRFRYGVQVNSLGLTEQQPENNISRILLEMLGVTLSKDARARSVQLPAWNEALGLPKPWDQQLSLRMQQILATETDLLRHGDIFEGSVVMEKLVTGLKADAEAEMAKIAAMGGAYTDAAIGYMKASLVGSLEARQQRIESGTQTVVGVNKFTTTEPSPLADQPNAFLKVDPGVEAGQIATLEKWRAGRDNAVVRGTLAELERVAQEGGNIMEASIACAKAGVTTGEWGAALRNIYGEYRGPTGVDLEKAAGADDPLLTEIRVHVAGVAGRIGHQPRIVVGKPGLDGHANGAEQIATRAAAAGMDVIYDGIRHTPADIVAMVKAQQSDVLGLSILSGSHLSLVEDIMGQLDKAGLRNVKVAVGGIIPREDIDALKAMGVSAVYGPADFKINDIVRDLANLADRGRNEPTSGRIAIATLL